jgi:hypothetical protein
MNKKEELLIALAKELDDWADISQFLKPLADTQECKDILHSRMMTLAYKEEGNDI